MPYVGVLYRRDDSDASPTEPVSPSSYWFPLFVIILACGGFLVWRRRNGDNAGPYGYVLWFMLITCVLIMQLAGYAKQAFRRQAVHG